MADKFDVFANTERDKERMRQRKDRVYEVSKKPVSELLVKPMFYMMIIFSALLFVGEILAAAKAKSNGYSVAWDPQHSFFSALVIWLVLGAIVLWMIRCENRHTFEWLGQYPGKYDEAVVPDAENGLTRAQADSLTVERRRQLDIEKNAKERYLLWLKRAVKITVGGGLVLLFFTVIL